MQKVAKLLNAMAFIPPNEMMVDLKTTIIGEFIANTRVSTDEWCF